MAAPFPLDETERLALLQSLDLLNPAPEAVFDRITRLVARTLNVPIALLSLLVEDRQWIKSQVGLDVSEMPRDDALSIFAIRQSSPTVVPDATKDPRFSNSPLVTGAPQLRLYAGVPIRTKGGLVLGMLCAIDTEPRTLTQDQIDTLCDLADLVMKEIEGREAAVLVRREREQAQAMVKAGETRFQSMLDLASVGIAQVYPDGAWISVNRALCQLLGYSPEELSRLTLQEITHPDDVNSELHLLKQITDGSIDSYRMEKRYLRKDGQSVWVEISVARKAGQHGKLESLITFVHDIQARKDTETSLAELQNDLEQRVQQRTQELTEANRKLEAAVQDQLRSKSELRRREAELRMVIENAYDAYVSTDEAGLITDWNQQAEEIFGWSMAEAMGKPLEELIVPLELREAHRQGMARYLKTRKAVALNKRQEVPAQRKDGSRLMVELRSRALALDGKTIFSAFLHDVTERKAREAEREQEARRDALTGLLNRRAFMELLPLAQTRADRSGKPMALLFIDLDGFKAVNDSFGHEAGDELLKQVAENILASVRKADSVVRLAGDEFTVVLESLDLESGNGYRMAQKLLSKLVSPFILPQGRVTIAASIGVATYLPGSGQKPELLIREADRWMYEAKRAGGRKIFPESGG